MTDKQKRTLRSVYIAVREAHIAGVSPDEIDRVAQLARTDKQQARISRMKRAERDGEMSRNELRELIEEEFRSNGYDMADV